MKDDELPTLPTGCRLLNGIYQLRVGIPDDLKTTYPKTKAGSLPTDAFRGSLKTSDRALAIVRAHAKIAEVCQDFEERRAVLRANSGPPLVPLTADLAKYIVEHAARMPLAYDEVVRYLPGAIRWQALPVEFLTAPDTDAPAEPQPKEPQPTTEDDLYRLKNLHEAMARSVSADLALGRLERAQKDAEFAAQSLGVRVDWKAPSARPTLIAITREQVKAWRKVAERSDGEPWETPPVPTPPETVAAPEVPQVFLDDVVPTWIARNRPRDDAVKRTRKALEHFQVAIGKVPLNKLSKAHGNTLVTYLLNKKARGFGDSTAANQAASINALMNVAVKADIIERNPFDLQFEILDAEEREQWTDEELVRLYATDLFRDPASFPIIRLTDPVEAYFALLLVLNTGLRIGEIAQLEMADLSLRNGIHALSIHGRAGTIKEIKSARYIPVADAVVTLGLIEYADYRRAAGATKLFPSLHRGKISSGDRFGRWFKLYREKVGSAEGPLEGSHKFRYTMRTRLAMAQVNMETSDALTGHAAVGSTGRKVYTATMPLNIVLEAVNKVRWPMVLERVWHKPA